MWLQIGEKHPLYFAFDYHHYMPKKYSVAKRVPKPPSSIMSHFLSHSSPLFSAVLSAPCILNTHALGPRSPLHYTWMTHIYLNSRYDSCHPWLISPSKTNPTLRSQTRVPEGRQSAGSTDMVGFPAQDVSERAEIWNSPERFSLNSPKTDVSVRSLWIGTLRAAQDWPTVRIKPIFGNF